MYPWYQSHINSRAGTEDRSGGAEERLSEKKLDTPPLLCLAFFLRARNFVSLVPRVETKKSDEIAESLC